MVSNIAHLTRHPGPCAQDPWLSFRVRAGPALHLRRTERSSLQGRGLRRKSTRTNLASSRMTGPNMSGHWQPLSRAQKRDSRDRYSRDKARHCKTMHPIVRGGPDGSAPPWPGGAHNGRMNATADTLPKASILVRARANPSANSAVAMGFKRSVGGAHSREPVDDAAEQKILQASNPAENG